MKTLKLSAFILAAVLFMGFGATTLSASEKSVQSEKLTLTIDGKVCNTQTNCKCQKCECGKEGEVKNVCTCQKCECGKSAPKQVMKCGAGKCGAANTPPNTVMKCGAGKCGASMNTPPKKPAGKCGAGKCGSN